MGKKKKEKKDFGTFPAFFSLLIISVTLVKLVNFFGFYIQNGMVPSMSISQNPVVGNKRDNIFQSALQTIKHYVSVRR